MNDTSVISRDFPGETSASRPWTSGEVADLRRLAHLGAEAIAEELDRSVASVKNQAYRLRISLRPPGARGGLILGQRRHESFAGDPAMRALRADALVGRVDLGRVVRRAEAWQRGADLCPSCAINPIEADSGFCTACHKRELARAHAREADELEAQRDLDRERQRKHRRKTKAASAS